MAPTADYARHCLRVVIRKVNRAQEATDAHVRVARLREGLDVIDEVRGVIEELIFSTEAAASVPGDVPTDITTTIDLLDEATCALYGAEEQHHGHR